MALPRKGKVQVEGNPLHLRSGALKTIKSAIERLYLDINDFVQRIDFTLLAIFDPITLLYEVKVTCLEKKG